MAAVAENTPAKDGPVAPGKGKRADWPAAALLLAAVGFLLALARSELADWGAAYTQTDSDYSYGPLIPAVVGVMLWHRRRAIRDAGGGPCLGALGLLLPALALLILAEKRELSSLASLCLLVTVWAGSWLMLGTRRARAAAFPLAYLACMVPLPGPLTHEATFGCQQLSTVLADRTLPLLGFPTTLSGNIITMDTFVLFVDVACSGMRLLLTLLVVGAALAWLADGPQWKRVLFFLGVVPLSLAVNTGRIVLLGISGECFGARVEHSFHDACGLLSTAVAIVIMLWCLRRIGCRTLAGVPLF